MNALSPESKCTMGTISVLFLPRKIIKKSFELQSSQISVLIIVKWQYL